MSELTYAELERLTGITFKTIKKRLEDLPPVRRLGAEIFFNSKDALASLYREPTSSTFDLSQQRARLAKVQADKIELEIAKMQENLVDVQTWNEEFSKVLISLKDKMRTMALKISDEVTNCQSPSEAYNCINRYTNEVLEDIAKSSIHRTEDTSPLA